jgi:hypothetical protein
MDEKHSTQIPRGVSTSRPVQPQPVPTGGGAASPKVNSAANSGTEKSGVVELSATTTAKVEVPKQSGALTAVFQASRVELDRLLAETQIIHERSWHIIHKLLEDSQLRASQAVDTCLARFEKEIHDRVSSEMSTSLQNLDVEAGARLSARLDQALAAAKQRQASIEQDLALAVAENRKQLDQISAGAMEGLRQREQNLLAALQKEAEQQSEELVKNTGQMSNDIQRLGDSVGTELKGRIEEAVGIFQTRIEQVWQEVVARAEKRIAETAQTCTVELAKQARQMVEREMSEFFSHALQRFDRSSSAQSSNQNKNS